METNKKQRACSYFRVSTVEQAQNQSLTVQQELIRKYAEYSNLEIINEYVDAGLSGRTTNRPALQEMLKEVDSGNCDFVLIYSLSRLGRNTQDTLALMNRFKKNNVTLFSYTEKIDTSSAFATFMFSLLSSLAELESNILSERISTVKASAKLNQRRYSKHLYGFDCSDKNLVVIPEQMNVVKYIYKMRTEGHSIGKIVKELDFINAPTSKGGKWYSSTVHQILKNKTVYEKHL